MQTLFLRVQVSEIKMRFRLRHQVLHCNLSGSPGPFAWVFPLPFQHHCSEFPCRYIASAALLTSSRSSPRVSLNHARRHVIAYIKADILQPRQHLVLFATRIRRR